MTPEQLLDCAIEFDGGKPVELNGCIVEPDDEGIDFHNHYKISLRRRNKQKFWAISNGFGTLNREGEWEHEPRPSSREDDYLERNRYTSLEEAFEILEKWKEKRLAELKAVNTPTLKEFWSTKR